MCTNKRRMGRLLRRIRWGRVFAVIVVIAAIICAVRSITADFSESEPTKAVAEKADTEMVAFMNEVELAGMAEIDIAEGHTSTMNSSTTMGNTQAETTENALVAITDYMSDESGVYSTRLGRYITDEEMYYLTMITCSEAGFESYEGKVAVAACILNRMDSEIFPNDVYGVIFQPYQFSSALDGKFYYGNLTVELRQEDIEETMWNEARDAVIDALAGQDPTREITGGSLFFYNPEYCSQEELAMRSSISCAVRIGNHIFYREW